MGLREAQEAGEAHSDMPPQQIAEMYVSVMLLTIRLWLVDYRGDGISLGACAAT